MAEVKYLKYIKIYLEYHYTRHAMSIYLNNIHYV